MISVIVATRNRHRELRRLLESLRATRPPSREWELIVVDNDSPDDTATVLREMQQDRRLPLRPIRESRLGKALACNRAICASRGSLLFFTDDDTIVDPDWLVNMERATVRWADAGGFGGRVIAVEDRPRPAWFTAERPLRSCTGGVVAFDLGDEPVDLAWGSFPAPVGANLACRRETFARHGLFREDLGPGPLGYHGDDTEFANRIRRRGTKIMYVADAVVRHPVDPHRMGRGYQLRWSYRLGRTSARLGRRPAGARRAKGVPVYLVRMLLRETMSLGRAALWGGPTERHRRMHLVAARMGTIRELLSLPEDFDPTRHVPLLERPMGTPPPEGSS